MVKNTPEIGAHGFLASPPPPPKKKIKKKPKKAKFQFNAKSAMLTYSCPTDKDQNPLTREAIRDGLNALYKPDILVVAQEKHESGKFHYHVFLQRLKKAIRSKNAALFDVGGVHPNIAKRKDGKFEYAKADWLEYLDKEDKTPITEGIDLKLWIRKNKEKKESKLAVIARDIYHNGLDMRKLVQSDVARSIVLSHKEKIVAFDDLCKEIKVQETLMDPVRIDIDPTWDKKLQKIAKWWNFCFVEKKYLKRYAGLWLYSHEKDLQKSTLLYVMCKILNGDKDARHVPNDKGWQEKFRTYWRLYGIDALAGPHVSFSLLEDLGSNAKCVIKKRNCKGGHNVFQGRFMVTSNMHYRKCYEDKDCDVLKARMLCINLKKVGCIPLVEALVAAHKLDMKEFYEEVEDPMLSDDDCSDDEEYPGYVAPM